MGRKIRWRNKKREMKILACREFRKRVTMVRDDWFSKGWVLLEFDSLQEYLLK